MVTFKDILKSNFVDSFEAITVADMFVTIGIAFILGLFIFFIYKQTYAGVMYSKTFGITLIALTMITSILILAVTSNVVLSLGMVGALSIVRFRTAIKEPSDIIFLFWSIAVGIIISAGFYPLGVIGSALIGVMLLIFSRIKISDQPYILVLHCSDEKAFYRAEEMIKKATRKHALKTKSISKNNIEAHYEIRLLNDQTEFISKLSELEQVENAILVSYNGEYMV